MRERETRNPRKVLRGVGATAAALVLAACGNGAVATPQSQNFYLGEGSSSGQVLGTSTEPISQLLADFRTQYLGTAPDFDGYYGPQCEDLVNLWSRILGGRQFTGGYADEIFGQQPDIFDAIKNDGKNKPQAGDIFVWSNSFNGKGGHTAVAESADSNGNTEVLEENGSGGVTVQEHKYSLNNSNLIGWERAKTYEAPPTSQEILDQYLPTEGLDIESETTNKLLRFWFETFTTKENIVIKESSGETIQISTNLDKWASNITSLQNVACIYCGPEEKVQDPFVIDFKITRGNVQKEGEIQLTDMYTKVSDMIGVTTDFSDVDKKNGWQLMEGIEINGLYRAKIGSGDFGEWGEFGETLTAGVKKNQWTLNNRGYSYNGGDPSTQMPDIVQWAVDHYRI